MPTSSDLADRYRGALLGLAVGDALGTTLEFAARDTRLPVTGMTGGGPRASPTASPSSAPRYLSARSLDVGMSGR